MDDYERAYRKVSVFKSLMLFFFSSRRFTEYAAKHDFGYVLKDADLQASYARGTYTLESTDIRINSASRSAALRRTLGSTGLVMLLTALVGAVVGYALAKIFGPLVNLASSLVQAVAVAIILWVTLWQLGREHRSFGGGTLSERIHG